MNKQRAEQLRDTATRRQLTPAEQDEWNVWLAASGSERPGWEEEMRLNQVLRSLSRPPVSSNFTARVLAALDRDRRGATRNRVPRALWPAWLRWRWQWAAGSLAVLALAVVVLQESPRVQARKEVVHSAGVLAEAGGPLSVDILQDFDAIYALPNAPLPSMTEFAAAFDQPVP
jgi:hypothetical protein